MPYQKKFRDPRDLVGVYMTPQDGIGKPLTLEQIKARLGKLQLEQALAVIAQIAFHADTVGNKQDQEIGFIKNLFRPPVARKAIALIKSDSKYHAVSSQVVVRLALYALVYSDKNAPVLPDEDIVPKIGDLLLAVANMFNDDSKGIDNDSLFLEIIRLGLWYQVHDYDRWLELSARLVSEILPSMTADVEWIDGNELIAEDTGLSFDLFWAITTSTAILTISNHLQYAFPKHIDTQQISQDDLDKWANYWSTDLEETQEAAKRDIAAATKWSFDTFYEKPLIRTQPNVSINVRPWFIANKATPFGYYSTVEAILRKTGDTSLTLKWSHFFGRAIENLGHALLDEYVPFLNRINEITIQARWGKGKVCDAMLLGDYPVAIDFVFRRINKMTATTGNMHDYAKDLKAGVTEKLEQIDDTFRRMFAAGDEPRGAVYPLVIVGAPFPVNGIVLGEVDIFTTNNLKIIGHHPKCRPPLIMDIQEFWLFLQTCKQLNTHPSTILEVWINSDMRVASFHDWYTTRGPQTMPPEGKRRYHKHAFQQIFGKDIE